MKHSILIIFFILLGLLGSAQSLVNLKSHNISSSDTLKLDSLSVAENSIKFFDKDGNPIDVKYHFDFETSSIIFDEQPPQDATVKFRSFCTNFSQPKQLFDRSKFMLSDSKDNKNNYEMIFDSGREESFFTQTELARKGSISRGVSFGNNQNVIVNSNLDLQLDGKIGENLFMSAVISDNNIPIQPDGNSQQLQEFDKVFIKIYNSKFSLIAGDFEQKRPNGYFLNYYKKSQGAIISGTKSFVTKHSDNNEISASLGAAVAKGKYRRQEISGVEGNQGPYKLSGANGEIYIVILAGTEKVYIDGILMTRGSDRDYVIDYNSGEISFTARQPINKDKRIIVEFEYSDQNYNRFLITSSNTLKLDRTEVWLNLYNESDSKSQPINQDLSDTEKYFMSQLGDDIENAVVPAFDSVAFNQDEIRYEMKDTIVEGVRYDSIFVYSTNEQKAYYRLSFALVGDNKGNYVKSVTAANGRVFEWVAPVNGVPQGNYIPYKKIVAPQRQQMATLGAKTRIGDKNTSMVELAISNNDLNTFSKLDAHDNIGFAVKTNLEQFFIKTEKNKFSLNVNYEFINKNFKAIEYFRETEFTRNWNLDSYYADDNHENMVSVILNYDNTKHGKSSIATNFIYRGNEYSGIKNELDANYNLGTWNLLGNISMLTSTNQLYTTSFLRHNASVTRRTKYIDFGLKELAENNIWKDKSLEYTANSYSFSQYEAFVSTPSTTKNKLSLNYKFRDDKLPVNRSLSRSTQAHDFSLNSELAKNPNHRLNAVVNYRLLNIVDTTLYSGEPEDNLTGKLEYSFRVFKGAITSTTLYEIGSGLENKIEYSYIEVAPGQGVYTWTDYNGNGLQEIDEFEVAYFADQANFIRIQLPTTEYIKVYSNQFNQSLNLNPAAVWKSKKGFLKFMSRFSDQFAYSISQKNTSSKFAEFANPFAQNIDLNELVSLNSSIRNTFSLNKSRPKFGVDYIVQSNNYKKMLTTGAEQGTNFNQNVLVRYNIGTKIGMRNTTSFGRKSYGSQFFTSKNYNIKSISDNFEFSVQPNINNRISAKYRFEIKDNIGGVENLTINDVGIEYRLNSTQKGALNVAFNYIHYKYEDGNNSAIDYEMLQGLLPGRNFTWTINFQRQLSNGLQINISYGGRKNQSSTMVHTASMQIRAYF